MRIERKGFCEFKNLESQKRNVGVDNKLIIDIVDMACQLASHEKNACIKREKKKKSSGYPRLPKNISRNRLSLTNDTMAICIASSPPPVLPLLILSLLFVSKSLQAGLQTRLLCFRDLVTSRRCRLVECDPRYRQLPGKPRHFELGSPR